MSKDLVPKKKQGCPSKYRPNMLVIVEAMGKLGNSKRALAGALDITFQTLYDWINPESPRYQQDLFDAVKKMEADSYLFWENKCFDAVDSNRINNNALALVMRNIHKWDSKQQVEVTGDKNNPVAITFKWQDADE